MVAGGSSFRQMGGPLSAKSQRRAAVTRASKERSAVKVSLPKAPWESSVVDTGTGDQGNAEQAGVGNDEAPSG